MYITPKFYKFIKSYFGVRTMSYSDKQSYALIENIKGFIKYFGVEKCGFLTLTFGDEVTDVFEASKRFNSFRTGFLCKHTLAYIGVYERHKSGVIHFHFIVAFPEQILYKTVNSVTVVFDHYQVKRRNYTSRNAYLGKLWKLFRETVPKYGFGERGSQILPISSVNGMAKYLAKYLTKGMKDRRIREIKHRDIRDKGFRLVRSSRSSYKKYPWRVCNSLFSWVGGKSREWRKALEAYIRFERLCARYRLSCLDKTNKYKEIKNLLTQQAQMNEHNYSEVMSGIYGSGWLYKRKDEIIAFYSRILKESVQERFSFNLVTRKFDNVCFDLLSDSFFVVS